MYGLCMGEATHRALATCSTAWVLRRDGIRIGLVDGEAERSLLRCVARVARKLDLLAVDRRLGVKLARSQLDDVLVASLGAAAPLQLVRDAARADRLLHRTGSLRSVGPARRSLRSVGFS